MTIPFDAREAPFFVVRPRVLAHHERLSLVRLAAELSFEPGRQGTGYEKAVVPERALQRIPILLAYRHFRLGLLGAETHPCDAYLLRYREGAYVPPHLDPVAEGQHRRCNALVSAAEGGELVIDGQSIALEPGDAVIFRPDILVHEVKPVTSGERLVFSVGTLVPTLEP